MSGPPELIARKAAQALASRLGADLPVQVEAAIADARETSGPARHDVTVVAIASVVIGASGLAWTLYKDLVRDRKAPPPDAKQVLVQQVLVQVNVDARQVVGDSDRQALAEAIVDEVLALPPPED
ncbi:MAG: hypothetical protein AAF533_01000 [Acidobacteriota bacterium]